MSARLAAAEMLSETGGGVTDAHVGLIGARFRRRSALGVPRVTIDIAEIWIPGEDPDGLGLVEHGCYVSASAWHAQIGEGEQGAERLDVDRTKTRSLMVHRHPLGRVNDAREPDRFIAPEGWIVRVEEQAARRYFKIKKTN